MAYDGATHSTANARHRVFQLAWPSILSELSTPLLGIVDTVVVGHLSDVADLAGVALAVAAYNPLLMVFNFLRMGTGGTTAQAYGAKDAQELLAGAARGIILGALLGVCICLLRKDLMSLTLGLLHVPDEDTLHKALGYYNMRVLGAPAALANYVVQAWFIGVQRTDIALAANLVLNISNAALCVLLGWCWAYGVSGVGAATAISNYLALAFGLQQIWCVAHRLGSKSIDWSLVFNVKKLAELVTLNANIFFRSICVMVIVTDFTSLSAGLGPKALAANSLLMQLQMLISFGSDGFANAAEAMIGEAIGLRDRAQVRIVFFALLQWGAVLALGFTCVYFFCGEFVLGCLTLHEEVVAYAVRYLPWQWIAPALSIAAYLLDGVFVGATRPKEMRNASFMALVGFWTTAHCLSSSNNGLWASYLLHLIIRATALLLWYPGIEQAAVDKGEPLLSCGEVKN